MSVLPNVNSLVIPIEKFTEYALNPQKQKDKAEAFKKALGYDLENYQKLIDNIKSNIAKYKAIPKPNIGYGERYQVIMDLTGENGKTAKVLTAWIINNNETRLTSVYIDN